MKVRLCNGRPESLDDLGLILAVKSLDVAPTPAADGFDDRRQGPPVFRERVDNRRGDATCSFATDDVVRDHLAELFRQHLLGDSRHQKTQRREMPGRFGKPVDDDELPLPAQRGQRRGERTIADGIAPARVLHSYPKVPSSGQKVGQVRLQVFQNLVRLP